MSQKVAGGADSVRRGRGVRRPQIDEKNGGGARTKLPQMRQTSSAPPSLRVPAQSSRDRDADDDDVDSDSDLSDSGSGDGAGGGDHDSGSGSSGSGNGSNSGSGSDAGSVDDEAEQAELDRLREGVKDVPFEIVQKLSAMGSARAAQHGDTSSRRARGPAHVKRANKNAPQEVSSKVRVGIIPDHVRAAARERKGRDPRFDRLSGKLSEDLFEKSYSWLKDVAQRDAKELRDFASKEKDADARAEFLLQASQIEQKLKQDAKKSEDSQLKRARKQAMTQVAAATGKAFWLKKRELRQIEIARKYETLKAKGKGAVDDYGNASTSSSHILSPRFTSLLLPPPL
jgi:ribosomal RNA-processing protein 36